VAIDAIAAVRSGNLASDEIDDFARAWVPRLPWMDWWTAIVGSGVGIEEAAFSVAAQCTAHPHISLEIPVEFRSSRYAAM
jgi:hypothetical protein